MTELANVEDSKILEREGKIIYKTNKHYRRLANVMEHPEFREFFEQYMKDWETTKTMIMFMKIYQNVEKQSVKPLTTFEKIAITKKLLEDKNTRLDIIHGMSRWSQSSLEQKHHNYSGKNTLSICQ